MCKMETQCRIPGPFEWRYTFHLVYTSHFLCTSHSLYMCRFHHQYMIHILSMEAERTRSIELVRFRQARRPGCSKLPRPLRSSSSLHRNQCRNKNLKTARLLVFPCLLPVVEIRLFVCQMVRFDPDDLGSIL